VPVSNDPPYGVFFKNIVRQGRGPPMSMPEDLSITILSRSGTSAAVGCLQVYSDVSFRSVKLLRCGGLQRPECGTGR
jgi:hypothetical protein